MKNVSAKYIVEVLDLTREYYGDVWREEEGDKELLTKRIKVAEKLESETGVSWMGWLDILSGIYALDNEVTNDEVFCALRVLGYSPEVQDD